jgi:hypothetical protein
MPFCSPLLNVCGGNCNSSRDTKSRGTSPGIPPIPEDRGECPGQRPKTARFNGYTQRAVGHAHKPRRQLSPGHWGRTSSATHRIPPTKRQAAADQCRRRGTNGDGLRGIARWYHQVPADLRCAVMPVPYRAADGQEDLAAPGERSTMNTLHRILAYLFRGKPTGPLVIGWSYQNGQRVVFRLPH